MHRRSFVIALVATACAPTGPKDEKATAGTPPSPAPPRLASGNPLLAIGNWSAPVSGWSQWLAVYEDGLLELRWFEDVEQPGNPFAQELRVRVLRVPPADLETLRTSLAHGEFKSSEPHYDEPGIHDGGSLTIADMATHHRRIIVVNDPANVPKPVALAQVSLNLLVKAVENRGKDGFAPGPDHIELFYMFTRGDENRALTVYEHGRIEVRTMYTSNTEAHEAVDYPTPHAVTGQAEPSDLELLRATLSELPSKPPKIEHAAATPDLLFVGFATREFQIALQPSPKMMAALSALDVLIAALD